MRVGELAGLKWESIDDQYIHIDLSEHRNDYKDKASELKIGAPKSGKYRIISLSDGIRTVLNKVRATGLSSEEGYVFVREDHTRCTAHDISCAASRRGAEAGLGKASIHQIRRTVNSILRAKLPASTVANMVGNMVDTNDKHYNYDVLETDVKVEALDNLFKSVTEDAESLKTQ